MFVLISQFQESANQNTKMAHPVTGVRPDLMISF
jgi:hypothetical protein